MPDKKGSGAIHPHKLALDSIAGLAMFPDTSGRLWSVHIDFLNGKALEANLKTNKIVFKAFASIRYKFLLPKRYRHGDLLMINGQAIYPVSIGLRNIETWDCSDDGG